MIDYPKTYGFCDAGCRRRVPTYDEFLRSATVVAMKPEADGNFIISEGVKYRGYFNNTAITIRLVVNFKDANGEVYLTKTYDVGSAEVKSNPAYVDFEIERCTVHYSSESQYATAVCYGTLDGEGISISETINDATFDFEYSLIVVGAKSCYVYNPDASIRADDGASAYEVAVRNGFEGTEEEWLASLKGDVGGVDIVHELGDREDAVMSQKATTQAIKNATEYSSVYDQDITDTLTLETGYFYSSGLKKVNQGVDVFACTNLIPVTEGDLFKITTRYGYVTVIVAEFDEAQTFISYNGEAEANTAVTDYEYTVPSGVSYIAISNRDQKYNPMVVKKQSHDTTTVKEKIDEQEEEFENLEANLNNLKTDFGKLEEDIDNLSDSVSNAMDAVKDATEYGEAYDRDITDTLTIENGYTYIKTLSKGTAAETQACTNLIPVNEGDFFKITATYGFYTVLIAEFDEAQTFISYNGEAEANTAVTDYEYTVPSGVSYIAISNRDQKYNPMVVKKWMRDTVKEKVDENSKSIENFSEMMLFAENGITNGNFATTDGWTAQGGILSVIDNIGKVTADKSNINVGVAANFGEYSKGDKVFFKARMKTPFGTGGSVQQNEVFVNIRNNSATGMKYAKFNEKITNIDFNDYYGTIEFDGDYKTEKTYFIVQFMNTSFIPSNAEIEFRDIISVNLTKAFGAGNEPTAEEFYSLLDGFENKYFEGEVNLFSVGANTHRIYNESQSAPLTHDITVTVGAGGDFVTLNSAIEYCSTFYPIYKKGGVKCYIKILAGTVINEQIYANQIDLQYITIIAEEGENNTEVISIDGVSNTMVIVDVDATGFANTANAHDARGNFPFIAGENAAKLPTIGCVFRLLPDTVEAGKTVCGMLCNRGSEGVVLAASGFDGFNDGCIANNESSITIREGISRNMTRWGVHARHNGEVSARSCVCTNCGVGACADRVADLDVREAVLNGSKVAIECNNISRANANGCHAQNCGAEGGYVVMVSGGGIVNCGSFDTANAIGTIYQIATNMMTANGIIFV